MLRKRSVTVVASLAVLGGVLVAGAPVAAVGSVEKSSVNMAPVRATGATGKMSAQGNSLPASRVTNAKSLRPSARCARYPASMVTVADLRVKKHHVRRGANTTATVDVRAQRGTPKGGVKLTILPTHPSDPAGRLFVPLRDGRATADLPTDTRGRFGVRARYAPDACSRFAPSVSGVKYYRVTARH